MNSIRFGANATSNPEMALTIGSMVLQTLGSIFGNRAESKNRKRAEAAQRRANTINALSGGRMNYQPVAKQSGSGIGSALNIAGALAGSGAQLYGLNRQINADKRMERTAQREETTSLREQALQQGAQEFDTVAEEYKQSFMKGYVPGGPTSWNPTDVPIPDSIKGNRDAEYGFRLRAKATALAMQQAQNETSDRGLSQAKTLAEMSNDEVKLKIAGDEAAANKAWREEQLQNERNQTAKAASTFGFTQKKGLAEELGSALNSNKMVSGGPQTQAAYQRLTTALQLGNGAGDDAAMVALLHLYEPTSTAMEGEVDRVKKAVDNIATRYKVQLGNLLDGTSGFISPDGRIALQDLGNKIYQEKANTINSYVDEVANNRAQYYAVPIETVRRISDGYKIAPLEIIEEEVNSELPQTPKSKSTSSDSTSIFSPGGLTPEQKLLIGGGVVGGMAGLEGYANRGNPSPLFPIRGPDTRFGPSTNQPYMPTSGPSPWAKIPDLDPQFMKGQSSISSAFQLPQNAGPGQVVSPTLQLPAGNTKPVAVGNSYIPKESGPTINIPAAKQLPQYSSSLANDARNYAFTNPDAPPPGYNANRQPGVGYPMLGSNVLSEAQLAQKIQSGEATAGQVLQGLKRIPKSMKNMGIGSMAAGFGLPFAMELASQGLSRNAVPGLDTLQQQSLRRLLNIPRTVGGNQ